MCKDMPVIPVNRVVDKKRIIGNKLREEKRGTDPHPLLLRFIKTDLSGRLFITNL
jgi:hypothetical protein